MKEQLNNPPARCPKCDKPFHRAERVLADHVRFIHFDKDSPIIGRFGLAEYCLWLDWGKTQ